MSEVQPPILLVQSQHPRNPAIPLKPDIRHGSPPQHLPSTFHPSDTRKPEPPIPIGAQPAYIGYCRGSAIFPPPTYPIVYQASPASTGYVNHVPFPSTKRQPSHSTPSAPSAPVVKRSEPQHTQRTQCGPQKPPELMSTPRLKIVDPGHLLADGPLHRETPGRASRTSRRYSP